MSPSGCPCSRRRSPACTSTRDSPRDMGNARSHRGAHRSTTRFLIPELLRVLEARTILLRPPLPDRSRSSTSTATRGSKTSAAPSSRRWRTGGFSYYGEVAIDKDPQVKAIRTKDQGLLFKTLAKDSSKMHMALADYLIQFRKPGDNPEPIRAGITERYGNPDGWITAEEWIEWAAPVWYRAGEGYPGGIRETDVLNVAVARDNKRRTAHRPLSARGDRASREAVVKPRRSRVLSRSLGSALRGCGRSQARPALRRRRAQTVVLQNGRSQSC